MRSRQLPFLLFAADMALLAFLAACGGGGGGSSSSPGPPPVAPGPALTITTDSLLPGTLRNHAYSATLNAANGQGALQWSISPVSSTTLFVDGISIDPNTGVLSGTANFAGTAGFVAHVTDSASTPQTASKGFTITAGDPLQSPSPQTNTIWQFQDIFPIFPAFQGGVFPFNFSLTGGSLPLGLRLDAVTGKISGSATAVGTFPCTLTIQDSFSPPEVASELLTISVNPPTFSVANSIPPRILKDRPFSGKVIAIGGIPPYHFALVSGSSLPPGLSSIDPSGQLNGTPTTLGTFPFTVSATDSSSPPQSANGFFNVTVAQALGRNDTVGTATPIGNGMTSATISPYIDPPGNAPVAGDNDYYKLVSLAGAPVHLETQAKRLNPFNPLDTVIEVVDGNGNRYTTCRQPGDTSSKFTSACINDDISVNPHVQDSALDFQVSGATNTATTFYVHVLDWRGDARPDMSYALQVSGIVSPLSIAATPLLPAARGLSYSQQLSSADGIGTVSWSKASGNLPPGLTLSTTGAFTGVATSDGTYSFTVQASDSGNPPQTATAQEVIQVAEPVKITSSPTFPDACVGKAYTFAVQTSGGLPPLLWSFVSNGLWVGINLDQSNGVFSGFSGITGTFFGSVGVFDATTHGDSQQVTLTVKQCP